jgi:hypothetical protein
MKNYCLISTIVIIVLLFLLKCSTWNTNKNVSHGTLIKYKNDTIIKIDTVVINSKPKIITKNNLKIVHDTVRTKGITMTIFDTLLDTFILRSVEVINVDTTFKDTVFITKIDTVIKDQKKWKYFKIGFGTGFVVGTITNLFIKK